MGAGVAFSLRSARISYGDTVVEWLREEGYVDSTLPPAAVLEYARNAFIAAAVLEDGSRKVSAEHREEDAPKQRQKEEARMRKGISGVFVGGLRPWRKPS